MLQVEGLRPRTRGFGIISTTIPKDFFILITNLVVSFLT